MKTIAAGNYCLTDYGVAQVTLITCNSNGEIWYKCVIKTQEVDDDEIPNYIFVNIPEFTNGIYSFTYINPHDDRVNKFHER